MSLTKPSTNYVLASTDNQRSEYIDPTSALALPHKAYVAVTDSGKGPSAARRLLVGMDRVIKAGALPLQVRLTVVVPTGITDPTETVDAALAILIPQFSTMLTGDNAQIDVASINAAAQGVLTLG